MKLILCTLLGFAVLAIGFAISWRLIYLTGSVVLDLKDKLRSKYDHRHDEADCMYYGFVVVGLAVIIIPVSYLIGKGICQ